MGGASAVRDWRFWGLLALFALVVGLELAVPRLDSDQAVTGLMGHYILQGEFPIFFWGQHHAGVPESYGAAVSFFLFGLSRRALNLVPALAALALILLLYRTGAVLFGRPAGLLAMLFATIVGPYMMAHYVRARAYYIEQLVLGQIVLLGAALWLQGGLASRLSPSVRARILVAMGLAAGVGLYCGFQIVDAIVPALLALLLIDPGLPFRRGAGLGLAAFAVGSAPFWIYNATQSWATFATGARFQGQQSAGQSAQLVFRDLLPVVLGFQDYVDTPPYLPWPLGLAIPLILCAAVGLLLSRVVLGMRALRRNPPLAGEAFLLAALLVPIGVVWYGRFVQVPRYLIAVPPVLALILARATQLVGRRAPALAVAGTALYLGTVGFALAGDLDILWPSSRAAYAAAKADDERLFAFLRDHGIDRAYTYEYWLGPRLTFDAGLRIIVAEPVGDRYPAHTEAVDASPHPAYVFQGDLGAVTGWIRAIGSRAERREVGPYTVLWGFTTPASVVPVPRAEWTVRTSPGAGLPVNVIDGRLDTRWASRRDSDGAAWIEVDLGRARPVAGVTLVSDRPQRIPQILEVGSADGPTPGRPILRVDTSGLTAAWRNGAPRIVPSRTVTVRFAPIETRHLRLRDAGPAGAWAVSELFVLAPVDEGARAASAHDSQMGSPAPRLVEQGERLERERDVGPALARYREAMKAAPDDPAGYAAYTRLAGEVGLRARSPVAEAARYAELGLADEALAIYASVAASLGPERTHVELTRRQARLAAEAGDGALARRLAAEADAAEGAPHVTAAAFGGIVELTGYDLTPSAGRPGDSLHLTYHWRLLAPPRQQLVTYVHIRREAGSAPRFGDDHPLPVPIRGLGEPQDVVERRVVTIPPGTEPGRYHIALGVWDPQSRHRLHRWWRGWLPTPSQTVELGSFEVLPPA